MGCSCTWYSWYGTVQQWVNCRFGLQPSTFSVFLFFLASETCSIHDKNYRYISKRTLLVTVPLIIGWNWYKFLKVEIFKINSTSFLGLSSIDIQDPFDSISGSLFSFSFFDAYNISPLPLKQKLISNEQFVLKQINCVLP